MGSSKRIYLISIFWIGNILQTGCSQKETNTGIALQEDWYREQKLLYYGIPVQIAFSPADETLATEVWDYLNGIDAIFNDYQKGSEIGIINSNRTKTTVELSPQLADAFILALALYRISDGAFDITTKPLRELWKEAEQRGRRPIEKELAELIQICGLDKVNLSGNRLSFVQSELRFDFGGVIKGIAVDGVIEMLKAVDIQSAMIQIGGETAVFGQSIRGQPHTIGIQAPEDLAKLWTAVSDQGYGLSISTSGNYRNPIIIDGEKFYHIIDPRSGMAVDTRILSVSIVFPETGKNWLADGLATAATVIGPEKIIPLIEKLGGDGLLILRQNETVHEVKTEGWDALTR